MGVKLTQSLQHWMWENHRDLLPLLYFGHVEVFTEEMEEQYIAWCNTEEGKKYLEGGECYKAEEKKDESLQVGL